MRDVSEGKSSEFAIRHQSPNLSPVSISAPKSKGYESQCGSPIILVSVQLKNSEN